MIEIETFERHTFRVRAVRVTTTNLAGVAEWCGGRVVREEGRRPHVQVPTGPRRESITRAYIGTRLSCLEKTDSFRVYKEQSFVEAFRKVESAEDKFAKVHALVSKVRKAQDLATYYEDDQGQVALLVEQVSREICAII